MCACRCGICERGLVIKTIVIGGVMTYRTVEHISKCLSNAVHTPLRGSFKCLVREIMSSLVSAWSLKTLPKYVHRLLHLIQIQANIVY